MLTVTASKLNAIALFYSEIFHIHVEFVDLFRILLPHIVSDDRNVDVHQLPSKPRELIIDTDGIVSSRGLLVLVFAVRLPLVRVHDLAGWMPHCEPGHSVSSANHLKGDQR